MPARLINLVGKRYTRLKVLQHRGSGTWLCQCDCGKRVILKGNNLKRGTKSCGCLRREKLSTNPIRLRHGMSRRKEYYAWCSMRKRCYNQKNKSYPKYGGRGIRVCKRWLKGFDNFLEDVGYAPSRTHSIDRENVNGHYEPNNVRWATKREQSLNRRPFKRRTKSEILNAQPSGSHQSRQPAL